MTILPFALATAAAFAGAAAYINLAEQPARLMLDDVALLKEWKPSYAKGLRMQASLALLSGVLGLAAWYFGHEPAAAVGGCLMLLNLPYTLFVVAPTNHKLGAIADEDGGPLSRALIRRWGKLHAVRTILSIAAACVFVYASV